MNEETSPICLSDYPAWRSTEAVSPFRYPGGKGFLTGFLNAEVEKLGNCKRQYVEPFAGGAGAALNLLSKNQVDHVHLNDLDIRVHSAWKAVLEENDRFIDAVKTCDVSLKTWEWAKSFVDQPGQSYSFDLGFATFFVNRTSRAGIISGSGPIGGYKQSGTWKIDARFYRETMMERIKWVGRNAERISLYRLPVVDFLEQCEKMLPSKNTLYFIDPPYVKIGSRLYLDGMLDGGHERLAKYINESRLTNWIITYDDHPLVRDLYKKYSIRHLQVNYSLGRTRKENEVLISPV